MDAQQKERLVDAVRMVNRTSKGWLSTLEQDLTPLYPGEQQAVLSTAQHNFGEALRQLDATLADIYTAATHNPGA